jgi:hypothetical protein
MGLETNVLWKEDSAGPSWVMFDIIQNLARLGLRKVRKKLFAQLLISTRTQVQSEPG